MILGIRFLSAYSSPGVVGAEFVVRDVGWEQKYRFEVGTDDEELWEEDGTGRSDDWRLLARQDVDKRILEILPRRSGQEPWTWQMFLFALEAWRQGYLTGQQAAHEDQ